MNMKKKQELIQQLCEICEQLDWVVGIPSEEGSEDTVDGLIIGKEEFVMQVVQAFTDDYEVIRTNEDTGGVREVEQPKSEAKTANKKKVTFH
jgi:hypothetical protein